MIRMMRLPQQIEAAFPRSGPALAALQNHGRVHIERGRGLLETGRAIEFQW